MANAVDEGESSQSKRRFGFVIGGIGLLVPRSLFCEYFVDEHISPLPNAPSHVEGLINVRGNIVPVYSIYNLLERKKTHARFIYLIGTPEDGAALIVDGKPTTVDCSNHTAGYRQPENLPQLLATCIDAGYFVEGKTWLSINHEQLFTKLAARIH